MPKHIKILGAYLIFISLAHFCLYIAMSVLKELEWLFYFDSQIAFFFIEAIIKHSEGKPPALISWLIELGILALGILMLSGRVFLKTFVVLESLLTLPYVLLFVIVSGANMSANHGFSRAELFFPSLVVIVNSLFPVSYAIYILWRYRQKDLVSII